MGHPYQELVSKIGIPYQKYVSKISIQYQKSVLKNRSSSSNMKAFTGDAEGNIGLKAVAYDGKLQEQRLRVEKMANIRHINLRGCLFTVLCGTQ